MNSIHPWIMSTALSMAPTMHPISMSISQALLPLGPYSLRHRISLNFEQPSYPMQMEAGMEKRLERLERMMCTTFDAIRQLSNQLNLKLFLWDMARELIEHIEAVENVSTDRKEREPRGRDHQKTWPVNILFTILTHKSLWNWRIFSYEMEWPRQWCAKYWGFMKETDFVPLWRECE